MIAANRCVADYLIEKGILALHRIHTKPVAEKLEPLMQALSSLGLSLPKNPRAADFGEVLMTAQARNPILSDALIPVVLGALSRAEYRPDEKKTGHFGLGYQRYLHFTSPIRRYPRPNQPPPTHCRPRKKRADLLPRRADRHRQPLLRMRSPRRQSRLGMPPTAALRKRRGQWSAAPSPAWSPASHKTPLFVLIPELSTDGMMRLSELPGYWKTRRRSTTAQAHPRRQNHLPRRRNGSPSCNRSPPKRGGWSSSPP